VKGIGVGLAKGLFIFQLILQFIHMNYSSKHGKYISSSFFRNFLEKIKCIAFWDLDGAYSAHLLRISPRAMLRASQVFFASPNNMSQFSL